MNDLVGKMAALINQYYEYGKSKGQNNDSDMYNLWYAVIIKKYVYIPWNIIHLSLLHMCGYK